MAYMLSHLPGMLQEFIALPKKHQKAIASKIDSLATNPRPQQSVLLKSKKGHLRLRVGDYLILYKIDDDLERVLIIKIEHRRESYR